MARRGDAVTPSIVESAVEGDDSALVEIYQNIRPRIERVAAFNLGDDEAAIRLAGDLLPRVLATLPHFDRAAPSVEAHCLGVAWPLMRKADKRSLPSAAYQLPAQYLDEAEGRVIETVTSTDPVLTAMRQLPPLWQELLQLRLIAGLTITDAAYVLQRQPGPLQQLQMRALGTLAEWIDQLDSADKRGGESGGDESRGGESRGGESRGGESRGGESRGGES